MKKDLGINKAFLPFGSAKTLWEYQQERLSKIFDKVIFSAKTKDFTETLIDEKNVLGVDVSEMYAPMLSIYSVLRNFDEAFFIAVDTPFFGENEILTLQNAAKNANKADAILAVSNGKIHPTIGIYRNNIVQSLQEHIVQNKLKLSLFLEPLSTVTVEFDEKFTQNINDKKGYENACLRI